MELKDIADQLGITDMQEYRRFCIDRVNGATLTHKGLKDFIYANCNTLYLETTEALFSLNIYTDARSVERVKKYSEGIVPVHVFTKVQPVIEYIRKLKRSVIGETGMDDVYELAKQMDIYLDLKYIYGDLI